MEQFWTIFVTHHTAQHRYVKAGESCDVRIYVTGECAMLAMCSQLEKQMHRAEVDVFLDV